VAKELASLDILSNERLIVGAGVGWVEGEFAALGIPFAERGVRMDESIKLIRASWREDPMITETSLITAATKNIRALPQPKRDIPIWIGGNSKAALTRAKKTGDGWHGLANNLSIEDLKTIVADLRANTGSNFRITLRTFWDALKDDKDDLRRNLDAYANMGIDGIVSEPRQRDFAKRQSAVEAMLEVSKPWQTTG
jgi:alkanesulfonate monooxygenase SsuD/methylene tetrahydromethanopterin reductase-like flavin-dependent oxidoreductase (luciferase family)